VEGRRNALTTALARWARGQDLSKADATALIRRLLNTRTKFRSSATEASEGVTATVTWAYKGENDFSPATCSSLRSFNLACTNACPFHEDYILASGPAGRRQRPERDESYVPPDPPAYTTISEARADIERTVRSFVETGGVWLLAIPPGAGKSRTSLQTLLATPGKRILYLAPQHQLIEQANTWAGGAFVHIRPRESANCERNEKAAEVAKRGFRADQWVCTSCPRFEKRDCGYWEQWRNRTAHWAMTYTMGASA
jgi:hypothetical protein